MKFTQQCRTLAEALAAACLVTTAVPARASAQVQEQLRVAATWRPNSASEYATVAPYAEPPGVALQGAEQPPSRARRCSNGPVSRRLLAEPALGALAGAMVGRVMFYAAGGLLAADHGAEFKRSRRHFTLVGAGAGTALGLVRVAVVPTCPDY